MKKQRERISGKSKRIKVSSQIPNVVVIDQNPELPQHIIFTEILPILPVKTLIRFKCVCKSWNSLISTPNFAKSHLDRTSHSSRYVLSLSSLSFIFTILNYRDCDSINFAGFYEQDVDLHEIDDFNFADCLPSLVGSCNGLLLYLTNEEFDYYRFFIYNPCTGYYLEVEEPNLSESMELVFGFGYVSFVDDYKIVVIGLPDRCRRSVFYVYSLRSRKWTIIRGFDKHELAFESDYLDKGGVLVNETLHWDMTLGIHSHKKCICVFDLVDEKYDIMQLPATKLWDDRGADLDCRLCCMDGCLCAWGMFKNKRVEMWMLKEYGVWESWTKLFRFNMYDEICESCEDFLGYTESGKVLIRTGSECLVLADLSLRRPKYVCVAQSIFGSVNYVESLVSPLSIGLEVTTET